MRIHLKDRLYELGAWGIIYQTQTSVIKGASFRTKELADNAEKVIKEEYGLTLEMYHQIPPGRSDGQM